MKLYTFALSALLAGFVSAQTFNSLPRCAQNCTINAIPSSCNLDPKCICEDAGFIKAITCCVAQVCDAADQEATLKYADNICGSAGVTNLPTAATCANNTASSTGSVASSTSGSATGSSAVAITSSASAASGSSIASSAVSQVGTSATSAAPATTSASSTSEAGRALLVQGLSVAGAAVVAALALM